MDLGNIVALCVLVLQQKGTDPEVWVSHVHKVTFCIHIILGRSESLLALAELLDLRPVEVGDTACIAVSVCWLERKASFSALVQHLGDIWQIGDGLVNGLRECEDFFPEYKRAVDWCEFFVFTARAQEFIIVMCNNKFLLQGHALTLEAALVRLGVHYVQKLPSCTSSAAVKGKLVLL